MVRLSIEDDENDLVSQIRERAYDDRGAAPNPLDCSDTNVEQHRGPGDRQRIQQHHDFVPQARRIQGRLDLARIDRADCAKKADGKIHQQHGRQAILMPKPRTPSMSSKLPFPEVARLNS